MLSCYSSHYHKLTNKPVNGILQDNIITVNVAVKTDDARTNHGSLQDFASSTLLYGLDINATAPNAPIVVNT
jgi:hypothetical protein